MNNKSLVLKSSLDNAQNQHIIRLWDPRFYVQTIIAIKISVVASVLVPSRTDIDMDENAHISH